MQRVTFYFGVSVLAVFLMAASCSTKTDTTANVDTNTNTAEVEGETETNSSDSSSPATAAKTVTITHNGSAFSPASITVNKGDKVNFMNQGGSEIFVAADPHPQHTSLPGFELKIKGGASGSFTFEKAGTVTYHNHFGPAQRGTVVVK